MMTKDDKWILTNHIILFDSEAEINRLIKKKEKELKAQNRVKDKKVFYEFIDNNSIIANELLAYYICEEKKLKEEGYTGDYFPMLSSFLN